MRRLLLFLLAAVAAQPESVPVVSIDGKGFGHGVGMAQDGAYWMGKGGATTPQILGHFYPGTALGTASGEVRVVVLPPVAANEALLSFPSGGEVRDARGGAQSPGFPVAVPAGGVVRVRFDGARYVLSGDGRPAASSTSSRASRSQPLPDPTSTSSSSTSSSTTTSSSTSTTSTTTAPRPPSPSSSGSVSSSRPLWAVSSGLIGVPARGRQYRGVIEATASGSPLRLVNHVDVETYLRGMGEVRDPSWPPASLRAQAIAARTYALRAAGELCDDQRCQVYLGAAAEYRAMDKAVADSRGQVLVHQRRLIAAVYSANGGGVSATRAEGFGTPDDGAHPYLRSAPYATQDPGPWSVQVALRDVAARLAYPGSVTDVRVARTGASGRALEVVLDGTAGQQVVTGIAFDRALGLRSTLFTLRVGTSDAPPPPPPPAEEAPLQAFPEPGPVAAAAPVLDVPAPDAVAAPPLLVPDTDHRRPLLPAALALLAVLSVGLLLAAWGIARRAGLSGGALRF
ncbi:MAG TPA: SpoIID/LytB domain-containing protein [Acidimicrobiales bacterium]|nr:SpoIID/LytB domain-containing protein [Acidimicrobiales bacterium]